MEYIHQQFAEICWAVLKERHPDMVETCDDDSFPSDVLEEALNRYFAGKKLVIGPRVQLLPADGRPRPKVKRAVTYA